MGREGGEILGLRVLKSVRSAELESERSRGVSEGPTPEHLFVVFQTCCEALGKSCGQARAKLLLEADSYTVTERNS